jgi:hypothetical protein
LELLGTFHKALLKRDLMARKIVGAYISPEQKKLLETVIQTLGIHENKVPRYTFLEYTTHSGPQSERVLGKI